MTRIWNEALTQKCKKISQQMIAFKPYENSPEGLNRMKNLVISLFSEKGFEIEEINNKEAEYRPVLIAKLDSKHETTIGFFGHYDVEPVDPKTWSTDPWELTEVDGRWQGRGVADNVVPLVQRILLSLEMAKHANLVFVLQGEEEIASPFAMKIYPNLNLPPIDLWIEETGYFYRNGNHRIMALNINHKLENVFSAINELNLNENRETKIRNRPLNKAFGNQGCPCLVHLLKDIPYIALGPNDDHSKIHGDDESMNPDLLDISARQILKAVEVFSQ